jgi:thymidylate synthase (FAD)
MKNTKLVWATPETDTHLAYIARVSNPVNQQNQSIEGLLRYMEREGHVSPFTMCNMCIEVNTSRAIGRQILRHWTIAPQEFSQRYASVDALGEMLVLECRMQDSKDRQNSLECSDASTSEWFAKAQEDNNAQSLSRYHEALARGVAKEQARCFLPEGNTPSRLYLNGNFRSWIHYLRSRLHKSTQKEHRQIAEEIAEIFKSVAPVTYAAFFEHDKSS